MKFTTATRFNLSAIADAVTDISIILGQAGMLAELDVDNATFEMIADEYTIGVEHGAKAGELVLHFPSMSAGEREYNLSYTSQLGEQGLLLYGTLTTLSMGKYKEIVRNAEESSHPILEVTINEQLGSALSMRWKAVSAAHQFAAAALEHANRAEAAAGSAEASAASAEASKNEVNSKLRMVDAVIAAWDDKMYSCVIANRETYTWWVGGRDTGAKWMGEAGKSPYLTDDGYWAFWDEGIKDWKVSTFSAKGEDGYSPQINSLGNWMTLNPATGQIVDSGVSASGKDGLDGTAIRRKLIEAIEQLPAEEERGVYYYVPKEAAKAKILFQTYEANDIGLYINGRHVYVEGTPTTKEEWAEAWLAAINSTIGGLTCVYCGDSGINGWYWARIEADFIGDYANGTTIEYGLCKYGEWAGQTCPKNFQPWQFTKMGSNGGYDIYAWLEPDGWVCVGDANDIATAEIYGLMKYGTDETVTSGAPVGRNADGQATVPLPSMTVAGAAKLSTANTLSSANRDGEIGLDADGKLRARAATRYSSGVVQVSRTDNEARILGVGIIPSGTSVDGSDRGGQLGCTRAYHNTYGMVKVAFRADSAACNNVTWNVPIAMRDDHTEAIDDNTDGWYRGANGILFFPLLEDGALQWRSAATESRHEKTWSTDGVFELKTSDSFSQSASSGLVLEEATTTLLGGVFVATGPGDLRENAVATASLLNSACGDVRAWALNNFYTKSVAATQEQLDAVTEVVNTKLSRSEAASIYATQTALDNLSDDVVHIDDPYFRATPITESEYNNLTKLDPDLLYIII